MIYRHLHVCVTVFATILAIAGPAPAQRLVQAGRAGPTRIPALPSSSLR